MGWMSAKAVKAFVFHLRLWSFHKAINFGKSSTAGVETFAASEAVFEELMRKEAVAEISYLKITTVLVVDSKDLCKVHSSEN